jgi:transposase
VRTRGSPEQLEYRRLLAIVRLLDGYTVEEVADFLSIDASSVRRWHAHFQAGGWPALLAQPVPGRPPRLTCTQEKIVRRWLSGPATEHGFVNELWTGARLARVIGQEFGLGFHPKYLSRWMRERGLSPQKPQRQAREHNARKIATWLERDWPRIKKKPRAGKRPWG